MDPVQPVNEDACSKSECFNLTDKARVDERKTVNNLGTRRHYLGQSWLPLSGSPISIMKGYHVMLAGTYQLEVEDRASGWFETLSSSSLDTMSRRTGSWTRSCACHPDSRTRRSTGGGRPTTVKA